jgi:zinc/manganese transport system substrate-binding protein
VLIARALLAAVLALAALPAFAQSAPAPGRLRVVATFSILGDLVAQIAGDKVDLAVLVGPDTDTHAWQPRPADARRLAGAQVLVSNGLGLEGWIDRLVQAAPFRGRTIVASTGVPTLAGGHGHGHDHGPDPHCWQDVGRTRRYVATIAEGLAAADDANAAWYRDRAAAYDRRLAELDQWVRDEIAGVPADRRKAITGHTSFGYLAAAYDVQIEAARGYGTGSEPSARDVATLIRLVRQQHIRALFVENLTNPALIAEIARDSGGIVGPRLYSDALSPPDGPAATYEAMMRHNVGALVAGMQRN